MSQNLEINATNLKIVNKVWGWEKTIINTEEYCGKILFIKEGHSTSWHYHNLKDECFYVQEGVLKVIYSQENDFDSAETKVLTPSQSLHMPRRMRHSLVAIKDAYIFEFSTHHQDQDSIRLLSGY